jgi:CRISPR/Cas system-associated endoribonuclease Cas2
MTGDKLESVKATIAKLITLANNEGATEAEAELAMERAKKLMVKYQLEEATVLREKIQTGVNVEALKESMDCFYYGKFYNWEYKLGWDLPPIFECKGIRGREEYQWETDSKTRQMHVVGMPNDLALVLYFFDYCQNEIARHMEASYPGGGQKVQNSFALGMVSRIIERLTELYERWKEEVSSECTDIVIYKEDAIAKTWKKEFPHTSSHRSSSKPLSKEFLKGRAAGDLVHLSSNLNQLRNGGS